MRSSESESEDILVVVVFGFWFVGGFVGCWRIELKGRVVEVPGCDAT